MQLESQALLGNFRERDTGNSLSLFLSACTGFVHFVILADGSLSAFSVSHHIWQKVSQFKGQRLIFIVMILLSLQTLQQALFRFSFTWQDVDRKAIILYAVIMLNNVPVRTIE